VIINKHSSVLNRLREQNRSLIQEIDDLTSRSHRLDGSMPVVANSSVPDNERVTESLSLEMSSPPVGFLPLCIRRDISRVQRRRYALRESNLSTRKKTTTDQRPFIVCGEELTILRTTARELAPLGVLADSRLQLALSIPSPYAKSLAPLRASRVATLRMRLTP